MITDKSHFSSICREIFSINGLSDHSSDFVIDKLFCLTERMLSVNEMMNLTAITDVDDIILKHYADSLTVAEKIPEGSTVIDVGTGAGFPSLVLAIARPDIHITALDSTAKRINYITQTAELLGLGNITAISARAEELAHEPNYRERFDIACARAVARLNVLCEFCLPYVKVNGKFIAMKANAEDEIAEASDAFPRLGGVLDSAECFDLLSDHNGGNNPRCIVTVKKSFTTPVTYPRNFSQIKKKPL